MFMVFHASPQRRNWLILSFSLLLVGGLMLGMVAQ